jgi:hypothetical protein
MRRPAEVPVAPRMRKASARLLMAALALLISFASPQPARALGSSAEAVQIGAFLTGLGDLDPIHKSFSAAFWLWSLSPETDGSPLDRMEFPNAIQLESPNAISESTPAGKWSQRKIVGTFRHGWDVRHFPFDRQLLRIELEESERVSQKLIYQPDAKNSAHDPKLRPSGWSIRSTRLVTDTHPYPTTFGDPRLPPGSGSSYAHAELQILVERTDYSGFWKLTAGAFAAALMALASYGLRIDNPSVLSPRFGLLAGSTFAAVISLRASASELGASGYTTLIDAVHSSVLLYILLATASGVVAWRRYQRQEDSKAIQWQERRMAGLTSLGFAALILAQILAARSAGAT